MSYFSWLHLTDLHRSMKEQHWLWPGVREIFFEDLKKLHEKCGPWDLVLFTGDLTQRGSAKEFQRVNELLEQLWAHFSKLGSSPKLLAVPGNHDLVRPKRQGPSVKLLQQWADQPDIREEFWEKARSPYRQVVTRAFKNYRAWWEKQPFRVKDVNAGILPGDFSVAIEKEGAKLGIVGFNTSFLQLTGDDYEGKLALHVRQFQEACGGDGPAWARQHHACLLLTHHPPLWLDPDSQQDLNAEITTHGRFVVHLCGHLHETAAREISEGGTEARRIWQGHSLFGLEYFGKGDKGQRLHGYTVGKIELRGDTGTLLFWPREARLQGGQRSIVPDYSLALTDEQHTPPKEFELHQPYTLQENTYLEQAFIPSYKCDIFVSYDKTDEEEALSLIRYIKSRLKLGNLLGRENVFTLWKSGDRGITDELIEQVATLIIVLSREYLDSERYQTEGEKFLKHANQEDSGYSRVFVVELENMEDNDRPQEFRHFNDVYRFYDDRYKCCNDLSYKLAETLKHLKVLAEDLNQERKTPDERPVVFLAEVTEDIINERDEMQRALEQNNFRVLPKSRLPLNDIDSETFGRYVDRELKDCKVFVQLLGSLPGRQPPDKQDVTYTSLQIERAEESDKIVLQWCNPGLDIDCVTDAKYQKLLESELVIQEEFENFKTRVIEQVRASALSQVNCRIEDFLVCLNSGNEEDRLLAETIGEKIYEADNRVGYVIVHSDEHDGQNQNELLSFVEKNCEWDCNGIIVIYGTVNDDWARKQLLKSRRVRRIAYRQQQLKITKFLIAAYDGPPIGKPNKLDTRFHELYVFNCRHGFDKKELQPFLSELKAGAIP